MNNKNLILGIDTSNYTTSLALSDINGNIILDNRKLLKVKEGERGLRQSEALFQHLDNLTDMLYDLLNSNHKKSIAAVCVSSRPRPVEKSYMPVFKAGVNFGKVISSSLDVPFFEFSHQEGHLAAVKKNSELEGEKEYLAYHFSGGTCEMLKISDGKQEIIGGSKDISFGQLIDRIGVSCGFDFPCGQKMDEIAIAEEVRKTLTSTKDSDLALKKNESEFTLPKIKSAGLFFNLSGIETKAQREVEIIKGRLTDGEIDEFEYTISINRLIHEIFLKISELICSLTIKMIEITNINKVLFTGGVSASKFMRTYIEENLNKNSEKNINKNNVKSKEENFNKKNKIRKDIKLCNIKLVFGQPSLSSDNAVGISYLGGASLWQSNL